jgi:hypothetical protein
MLPGMPARWLAVCALCALTGLGRAHADKRREVAVVDLSEDPAVVQLAERLYDQLLRHWALQPLGNRELDAALTGAFRDDDRAGLDDATKAIAHASDQLTEFKYEDAEATTRDAFGSLATVSPIAAVAPAADLAFALGEACLGQRRPQDASLAFALVHRLDPMRSVDPARYLPGIINAYDAALAIHPAREPLEIRGSGRAWIDGVEVGSAPGTFDVDAGLHLVQLAGPDRLTQGALAHSGAAPIAIADAPANLALQVARARVALAKTGNDAVARAGMMRQLAALLFVHDAVLIAKADNGGLVVQTWRDQAPGFSASRVHGSEPPIDLLEPLSPPEPPATEPVIEPAPRVMVPLPPVQVDDTPPWYRRRWVQVAIVAGVAAVVTGAVVWANRTVFISDMPMTTFK